MVKTKITLSLQENKACPLIVLIHGGPGMDSSYFSQFVGDLNKKYSTLCYNLGQFSDSYYTMGGLLSELNRVLDRVRDQKVILLGHSFGSALILEYIEKYHSANIQALILISWIYDRNWAYCQSAEVAKTVAEIDNADYSGLAPNEILKKKSVAYRRIYFHKKYQDKGRMILKKINYKSQLQSDIFKNYLDSFDCKNILQKIEKPVLSIAGKCDLIVRVDYIRRAYRLIKKLSLFEVEECCHFPFIESEKVVLTKVIEFVDGLNKNWRA